jgi:hypothetical protein
MSEIKGLFSLVYSILRNPSEGFSHVRENDLLKGILIEVSIFVLAVISTRRYLSKLPPEVLINQIVGNEPSTISSNLGLLSGIGIGFSILFGWIISSVLMHGISKLLGGEGSLKRFFTIHGFSSIPYLINYLIRTIDAYTINNNALLNFYLINNEIKSNLFKILINMNLFNIFGLYTLTLVVFGLRENYGISRVKALTIALIPWLLYLMINILIPR